MFGSHAHHQVPRYFSEDDTDPMAVGMDVFSSSWLADAAPYCCPPWTEITPMLEKIALEGVPCMVVLPERPQALWWPLFASIRTDWWRCLNPLSDQSLKASSPSVTVFALLHGPGNGLLWRELLSYSDFACSQSHVPCPPAPIVTLACRSFMCPARTLVNVLSPYPDVLQQDCGQHRALPCGSSSRTGPADLSILPIPLPAIFSPV